MEIILAPQIIISSRTNNLWSARHPSTPSIARQPDEGGLALQSLRQWRFPR